MKKTLLLISLISLFLATGSAVSQLNATTTFIIYDTYWGAVHRGYGDIIGDASYFDINRIEVTYEAGKLKYVDIFSRYFNNIGIYETQLGDLFISTDGWNPFGTKPYPDDNFYNGEKWEYAFALDNHLATSGNFDVYQITSAADIILSWAPSRYVWRDGQEVQVNKATATKLMWGSGSWALYNTALTPDTDDYLRFDLSGLSSYGFSGFPGVFHWGPTCGNDVIEGIIPEPSTALLLGSGLIGLGLIARYRRKKSCN